MHCYEKEKRVPCPSWILRALVMNRRWSALEITNAQVSCFLVEWQGQRVDGARAEATAGHRAGWRADDGERQISARGDARGARGVAAGAGGCAGVAALEDSHSLALPQRRLRARDGGCRGPRGRRRLYA